MEKDIQNIKDKKYRILIYGIIIMNIFDLIFTYVGLKSNYIEEGNQLMANIYMNNEFMFVLIKVIAIIFFATMLLKFTKKFSLLIKTLLWIAFIVYLGITFLHIYIIIFYSGIFNIPI